MEQRNKPSVPSSDVERSLCPKCGKPHKGECLVGNGRCYRCKEMGHTAQKSPLSSDKGKFQGRIFTMTKEGANPDSSVISGNILISEKEALTLIDTGATHSFMSEVFMHSLSREPTIMPLQFNIMLPSGDKICPTSILKACPVQIGSRLLYADFIVISMVAFDVILGMDWLYAYRAVIDCVEKTVKFLTGDYDSDEFFGLGSSLSIPLVSCLQATKLLNKGCTGFLALVSDVNRDNNLQIQDIDVVQEYPDVFADDVPSLPPDREVEFVIELSPGTAPISKAPYRMAPIEMKELKNRLQELIDKGFIRPSSSPWGAPKELNMRQRRWLELLKDYDCTISYHPGKANVVADALSCKSIYLLGSMIQKPLLLDLQRNEITLVSTGTIDKLSALVLRSTLIDGILKEQQLDIQLLELKNKNDLTGVSEFVLNRDGLLTFRGRICVPRGYDIRKDILIEAHTMPYSVHPGSTKMYQDLRRLYWWPGLPRTSKGYNSIWVIVDRLTKSAHFLSVKTTFTMNQYAEVYVAEIVRLHGIHVSIVSDRDPRFTSEFWKSLHRALGTKLAFSTAYHPQSDGQSERVIQILEDMLRACTIDFPGSWDSKLPLFEFTYNNSYQSSIGMTPYEALYGRRCRSPLYWEEVGERKMLGPELVQQTADVVALIQERMKTAESRQKSYADVRRRPLKFEVDDHIFIKISPCKGVMRFGKKDLLPNLSYEEVPIQILDRKVKVLRNKDIGIVKVLWRNQVIEEATWEPEEEMKHRYPNLFKGFPSRSSLATIVLVVTMESKSIIADLNKGDKLNGDNYDTWCHKIGYVLDEQDALEGINQVMQDPGVGNTA
ncbi:uncharacterized protein [Primulina eburnea]|uniref:uncharacterized protein n=1 Tax=Primulina eburnea TaxID=1245227 RepID=UPI003C6CA932